MDSDSSTKFIGSLTKFLQSLCNGYVEFQKGVELVGHIYLSIDTGEKVDYILHERVSKNDENSVSFVSNSYHAQPFNGSEKMSDKKDARGSVSSDEDDIMIVDRGKETLGSTNTGTVLSGSMKRKASSMFGLYGRGSSSLAPSAPKNRLQAARPPATATSQGNPQENISVGDMKLEQITSDELLSLASQVGDGGSSQAPQMSDQRGGSGQIGQTSLTDTAGRPVWIKQEALDDTHGGPDTGWSYSGDGHSDSSNSSSNLYPVMMHQNSAAFSSTPVFPTFVPTSGSSSSHHALGHSLPGTSGAANLYANPLPGTSGNIANMDPAAKNTVHLVAEGEYGTGKPRPGRVSLDCAKAYEMVELVPDSGVFIYPVQRNNAVIKFDGKKMARYLLSCFYSTPELIEAGNLSGANQKKGLDPTIVEAIVGYTVAGDIYGLGVSSDTAEDRKEKMRLYKRQYRQRIRANPQLLQQYKERKRIENRNYYQRQKLLRLSINKKIPYHRLYRERLKQDPVRYREYLSRQLMYTKRYKARKKLEARSEASASNVAHKNYCGEQSSESGICRSTKNSRRYRQRIKQNPGLYQRYCEKQRLYQLRHKAKRRQLLEQLMDNEPK